MEMVEKVAYLKGLAEGLNFSDESKEAKLLLEMLDLLEEMADAIDGLEFDMDMVSDDLISIDEELEAILMDDFYEELSIPYPYTVKCQKQLAQDAEEYHIHCPECGTDILLSVDHLDDGELDCPDCGESLEIDYTDMFDEELGLNVQK